MSLVLSDSRFNFFEEPTVRDGCPAVEEDSIQKEVVFEDPIVKAVPDYLREFVDHKFKIEVDDLAQIRTTWVEEPGLRRRREYVRSNDDCRKEMSWPQEWLDRMEESALSPYDIDVVFEAFKITILKIDLADTVKRVRAIVPVDDYVVEGWLNRVQACNTLVDIQVLTHQIFTDLPSRIQGEYSDDEVASLISYLESSREYTSTKELFGMVYYWLEIVIERKTAMGRSDRYYPEREFKYFVGELKSLVADLAGYLAGLAESQVRNRVPVSAKFLHRVRPEYMEKLCSDHKDPIQAAKHVAGVALNSIRLTLEHQMFYDFRHRPSEMTDKPNQRNHMKNLAYGVRVFGTEQKRVEIKVIQLRLEELVEGLKREVQRIAQNYPLRVLRGQTYSDSIMANRGPGAKVRRIVSTFMNNFETVFAELLQALEPFRDRSMEFERAIALLTARKTEFIECLDKEGTDGPKRVLKSFIQEAVGEFCDNSKLRLWQTKKIEKNPIVNVYSRDIMHLLYGLVELMNGRVCDGHSRNSFPYGFHRTMLSEVVQSVGGAHSYSRRWKEHIVRQDVEIYPGAGDPSHIQAPPSASGLNTVWVQALRGCSHRGACTFCVLDEHSPFTIPSMEGFERHIKLLKEYFGRNFIDNICPRVFLGGGNALAVPTEKLLAMMATVKRFSNNRWDDFDKPKHGFECYARVADVNRKSLQELCELRDGGLQLVYIGLESGDDDVLELTQKGHSFEDYVKAVKKLREACIEVSVMIMPGLGGVRYATAHAANSAGAIGETLPKYVTFLPISVAPGSKYDRDIRNDVNNRHMTPAEVVEHTAEIRRLARDAVLANSGFRSGKVQIASHASGVTPVASTTSVVFEDKLTPGTV